MTKTSLLVVLLLSPAWQQAQSQWVQTSGGPPNRTVWLVAEDEALYAGVDQLGSALFISTDHGNSWLQPDSSIREAGALAIGDSAVFAVLSFSTSTGGQRLYRSTNGGLTWTATDTGLSGSVTELEAIGTKVFAGTYDSGVFFSSNSGSTWSGTGSDIFWVTALAANETGAYAGTYPGRVFQSSNNGANWTAADSGLTPSAPINDLAISGTTIFATTGNGVFRLTMGEPLWTQVGAGANVLLTRGLYVFVSRGAGVFLSSNSGDTWTDVSSGLPANYPVVSLACDSVYIYAGLYYGGVWRRPLSEVVTSIQFPSSTVPSGFSLEQNYPNPFNPISNFGFRIAKWGMVELTVFDILGREVATLVNEPKEPGTYTIRWDASGVSSGVYFCRLKAGEFVASKKLMLLK